MRPRSLMLFALIAIPLGVVIGCEAQTGNSDKTEIYFYQRGYVAGGAGAGTTLTDAAVEAFEARRPDVEVHVVGLPWSREGDLKLRAVLLNRRKVDVFRLAHDQVEDFLPEEGELLSPIDTYLTAEDRADISAGALEALMYGGETMAWPLWSTATALIGNRAIMRERGIEPPAAGEAWDWDEFLKALNRGTFQTAEGDQVWGLTVAARPPLFEWSPLIYAHTGEIFAGERGEESGEGEGSERGEAEETGAEESGLEFAAGLKEALRKIARLRELGVVPPSFGIDDQPTAQAQFMAGRATFILSSPGFIRQLAGSGIDYAIMPPPVGDYGRPITTGALGAFAVVAHPDEPEREEAAHALAKFLTSREIAEEVPGWYLAPPVRTSIENFYEDPAYAGLDAVVESAVYLTAPGGPAFVQGVVIPKLQAVLIGAETPEEALAEIEAAYERRQLD